jgi:hypothetical protein
VHRRPCPCPCVLAWLLWRYRLSPPTSNRGRACQRCPADRGPHMDQAAMNVVGDTSFEQMVGDVALHCACR